MTHHLYWLMASVALATISGCGNAAGSAADDNASAEPTQLALAANRPGRPLIKKAAPAPLLETEDFLGAGGPAGCISASVTGRQRAILERLGGQPCETVTKPVPGGAATTGSLQGDWSGQFDGGTGYAKFRPSTGGSYNGEISVERQGCGGSTRGVARSNGSGYTFRAPLSDGSGGVCDINLTPVAGGLRVEEGGNCYVEHGQSCAFVGTLRRKGGAPAASAPVAQWPAGTWVAQGAYCASSDAIRFGADGSYSGNGGEVQGRYSLSGGTMLITFAQMDPDTGREGRAQRATVRVGRVGPNDMTFGKDKMKRCPAGGGKEPWHPNAKFDTE